MPVTSWNGGAVKAKVNGRAQRNLDRAAIFLVAKVKDSFGSPASMPQGWTPDNPYQQWRHYDKQNRKGSGLRTVGAEAQWRMMQHSRPGDPPFVQTGALRRGVTWRKGRTAASRLVGVIKTVSYAIYLELGTRAGGIIRPVVKRALYWPGAAHPVASAKHKGMAARPYLKPALTKYRTQLLKIIGGGK